jgi:transposase
MLPKEYGEWNHVYQRFCRWSDKGIWHKMLYYFAKNADMEYIMVDSTILRSHACAAGAKKKMEKV